MKTIVGTALAMLVIFSTAAQEASVLPQEVQIKMATQVLSEEDRDGAMVYGYDSQGNSVVLREGSNNMVCLADDPNKEGVSVSCYNKKLDPFMKRGRDLTAEGKGMMDVREIRQKEVEAGTLKMPDAPSLTYVLSGDPSDLNPETGELENGYLRYVIYMPYATTESTGLPASPQVPGMPWLMDPGTHRAHIMISPPREE